MANEAPNHGILGKLTVLAASLVILLLVPRWALNHGVYDELNQHAERLDSIREQNLALERENLRLQQEIERSRDTTYLRHWRLRDQLGVIPKGDFVIVVE